jgi:hypothetical protein
VLSLVEDERALLSEGAATAETKLAAYLSRLSDEKRAQLDMALGQVPSKDHPFKLSMWICSMLPASPQCKTVLLSTTSTSKRLKLAVHALNLLLNPTESVAGERFSPSPSARR